jgi:conjugative relaxase-like TrwC/TraI family protein
MLSLKIIPLSYREFPCSSQPLAVAQTRRYVRCVLTVHKIPGTSATRWAKYMLSSRSRADYQLRDGDRDVPSRWHGSADLLSRFGLSPGEPVKLEDLRQLMHGFNPVTKEAIRPVGADGTRTAGVDLTYSPPKDVSALWAVASDYRRAQIEAAHTKAVASTLKRIEREVRVVRRKTNGEVTFERAKSLLAAEAVHTTSRLSREQPTDGIPDPQLHSHVSVLAAERTDGKMAAVESRQLYKAAREGGSWYRAELAANLQELGLEIERRTGHDERYFGIAGVPKSLSKHWSSRDRDVDIAGNTFRRRKGREPGPRELDKLTLQSRGPKSTATERDINHSYRAVGGEHEFSGPKVENTFADHITTIEADLRKELLAEVTRHRSMITTTELRSRAYELSTGVSRPADADQMILDLERSGELIRLHEGMWTTRALREVEQATLRVAEQRANENTTPVSDHSLRQAERDVGTQLRGDLSPEQRHALQTITGPGGIAVLIGRAGTGKGVVLSAATRSWHLEGNQVIGTAVAGATAKRLQADTGTDQAITTDALISRVQKGHLQLDHNTVVIVDEAGMTDTHRMANLAQITARSKSKLLLAGDSAQLTSIGPGGLFKQLENKVPTAELTEVHRARHQWERDAWEDIRQGEPGKALARYQAHDRLHIHDTRQHAMQAMVHRWDHSRQTVPDAQAVMITDSSNTERDQLNAMAQDRRAQAGELGKDRVQVEGKPYGLAAGDQIIFTGQYRVPGHDRVENGITGTVINANDKNSHVTIQTREAQPRNIDIDTNEFSDISLGYAVHVYKAQGLTAETSQVLTGGWQTDRENIYVSVTRARESTNIHVTRDDLGELDTDAIAQLAELMHRTSAQEAAITKEAVEPPPDVEQTMPVISVDPAEQRLREIQDAIQANEQRQRDWDNGILPDRGNDVALGIE